MLDILMIHPKEHLILIHPTSSQSGSKIVLFIPPKAMEMFTDCCTNSLNIKMLKIHPKPISISDRVYGNMLEDFLGTLILSIYKNH